MGTAEGRSIAGVIAGVLLGVGIPQCVSAPILGWTCIAVAAILLTSLYFGFPFKTIRIGQSEGSMEGIPWTAPIEYQVAQFRQVITWLGKEQFDLWSLNEMIPKTPRTGCKSFYEPLHAYWGEAALGILVKSGELEVVKQGVWKATGKAPTKRRWLRWSHGT